MCNPMTLSRTPAFTWFPGNFELPRLIRLMKRFAVGVLCVVLFVAIAGWLALKTSRRSIAGERALERAAPVEAATTDSLAGQRSAGSGTNPPRPLPGPRRPDADEAHLVGVVVMASPEGHESREPASDRRILLGPNELVFIELDGAGLDASTPVSLRADNGGLLNEQALRPEITASPGERFSFRAGGDRGLYTVTVSQRGRTETLEFWVGSEPPQGEAGPPRNFTAPGKG